MIEFMGAMGLHCAERTSQHFIDLEKPAHLIGHTEQYCLDQIAAAEKTVEGLTPKSVLFTIKRGVIERNGKFFETVVSVIKQDQFVSVKTGELVEVPLHIIMKARQATPVDYKFAHQGVSVKLNNLIRDEYPEDVADAWDWANNSKFGYRRFGPIGEDTIRFALYSLVASWHRGTGSSLCDLLNGHSLSRTLNWIGREIRVAHGDLSNVDAVLGLGQTTAVWGPALAVHLHKGLVISADSSLQGVHQGTGRLLLLIDSSSIQSTIDAIVAGVHSKGWSVVGVALYNHGQRLSQPESLKAHVHVLC
jgi:hypothetical protein